MSTREGPGPAEKTRSTLRRGVSTVGDALESRPRFREEKGGFSKRDKVRFDLQELNQSSYDESKRMAGVANISSANLKSSDCMMRNAKLLDKNRRKKDDAMQDTERDPNRFSVAAPEAAPEAALKHKSEQGLYPNHIVTRYDATSPEAKVDGAIDQKNPHLPEQDGADVGTGVDVFIDHRWDRPTVPAKRLKLPRNMTNVTKMGNVYGICLIHRVYVLLCGAHKIVCSFLKVVSRLFNCH